MRPDRHRRRARDRRGSTLAENAVAYALAILLVMGTMVTGLGVFRYQQLAALAREGARWASVHGSKYQQEQNKPAPTSSDVLANAITPKMVGLNSSNLTCTLTMASGTATVTLTYQWTPETFLTPITMSSTSVMPISY